MKHALIISLLLFAHSALSEIQASKDSLWISNSLMFSRDDVISLVNTSSDSVSLDSAFIEFEVLDTTDFSYVISMERFEFCFIESSAQTASVRHIIPLKNLGDNRFMLYQVLEGTLNFLGFSPDVDSIRISRAQIGACFACNSLPEYPCYMRGKLSLYFSNNQKLDIRIYSNNTSTVAVKPVYSKKQNIANVNSADHFLLDGSIISDRNISKSIRQAQQQSNIIISKQGILNTVHR